MSCCVVHVSIDLGECVLCMGSACKVSNTAAFMQADIACSLDPAPEQECMYRRGAIFTPSQARTHAMMDSWEGEKFGESPKGTRATDEPVYANTREFAFSEAITALVSLDVWRDMT